MTIHSIGVHIKVKNFAKSVAFYEALGFTKVFQYGPDQEVKEDYNGMVFEHGGARLEVADGHRAVKAETFQETINSSKESTLIIKDTFELFIVS